METVPDVELEGGCSVFVLICVCYCRLAGCFLCAPAAARLQGDEAAADGLLSIVDGLQTEEMRSVTGGPGTAAHRWLTMIEGRSLCLAPAPH